MTGHGFAIAPGPFEPTWESLHGFQCPAWFRDAKFGIWSHWGPQSVPMCGDWYARNMYIEGHPHYLHHWRTYGHPSRCGYKDVAPLWKAERFDPMGLMELFAASGARYFLAQAVHHDNFDNWNSRHHAWNAVHVGPRRDIVGEWAAAARAKGLKFGVSEHLAASFTWFATNKGADTTGPYAGVPYDGHDPAHRALYLDNAGHRLFDEKGVWSWYTTQRAFHETWQLRMRDLMDQHQPDLLYSDGGLPFYLTATHNPQLPHTPVDAPEYGLRAVAHLYNQSAARNGGVNQAVYTQKDRTPGVARIGVLDMERAHMLQIMDQPWQTDTCVAGWFYDLRAVYKTPRHLLTLLVDIVSKNGNLLLNFVQRPDGTLDEECLDLLKRMSVWLRINGEGIFDTRPWTIAGEGPTQMHSMPGSFKEEEAAWTTADYRFTAKGDALYAFQMKYPEQREAFIRSLGLACGRTVRRVMLLGFPEPVAHHQYEDGLLIHLPEEPSCDYIPCYRIQC